MQRGFTTSSAASVLPFAGKGPFLALFCLAQSPPLKSGSTAYFHVFTFSDSNSVRKTIFRTLSSPHHPHASSCQKLAYGRNVFTAQNRDPWAQFVTPQAKDKQKECLLCGETAREGRPCPPTAPGRPAVPPRALCRERACFLDNCQSCSTTASWNRWEKADAGMSGGQEICAIFAKPTWDPLSPGPHHTSSLRTSPSWADTPGPQIRLRKCPQSP